jgi:hypothetical protein
MAMNTVLVSLQRSVAESEIFEKVLEETKVSTAEY